MKRKIMSIFVAAMMIGGINNSLAFAEEKSAAELDNSTSIVNEQCNQIEVIGRVCAIYYITAPEDGSVQGIYLAGADGISYDINGYDIGKYFGKTIRVKGCLVSTHPHTIEVTEVEVIK